MRILAFHLLNDYSGSPKVLGQLIKGWVRHGIGVSLTTSSRGEGFLSGLPQVKYHSMHYRFSQNKFLRLVILALSQVLLFFRVLFTAHKSDIIYINTVLPFGAALAGKLRGCRVIYHVHETSIRPAVLKRFLFGIASVTASEAVFVSKYLADSENRFSKSHILYNALPEGFAPEGGIRIGEKAAKNVLMVCSLKWYKGVDEFVLLAKKNPDLNFRLVVNAGTDEINNYFKADDVPSNLEVFPVQKDVRPFYLWADIVLNLSRPDGWVETFGLTVIEAMAYGLPVIVPPVGGIAELVEDGVNGYKADSRNMNFLSAILGEMTTDILLYTRLAQGAQDKAASFSEDIFLQRSLEILGK